MSVLSGSQPIWTVQITRARKIHGSHISLGNEVIVIDPHKGLRDDENDVCLSEDNISPVLPLALMM